MKQCSAPRRFLPQPLETSEKSSRKAKVEHSGRTSGVVLAPESVREAGQEACDALVTEGKNNEANSSPLTRRYTPQVVETTRRSSRQSVSETLELNSKSSGDVQWDEPAVKPGSPMRKFLPEPVEVITEDSRKKHQEGTQEGHQRPEKRHFVPEPVETTITRHRGKRKPEKEEESGGSVANGLSELRVTPARILSPRKFSPELIETARGSYRREAPSSLSNHHPYTDHPSPIPGHMRPPTVAANSPTSSSDDLSVIGESRFSAAAIAKRQHQNREHSFIVPDLPSIDSGSSEENSDVPSISTSPSASSDDPTDRKRPPRKAKNANDTFSGYVLSLAAQVAEKQLQEQAMAAFPNERVHQPVDHFAVEHEDDEDRPQIKAKLSGHDGIDIITFRRESAAHLSWEVKEMQRHHSQLEQARSNRKKDKAGDSKVSSTTLTMKQNKAIRKMHGTTKHMYRDTQKGVGLTEMRNAASPPMLGNDLVFPLSISPKVTRCNVDQVPVPRKAESHLDFSPPCSTQLWTANINVSEGGGSGLWMGMCQRAEGQDTVSSPQVLRSGMVTPMNDAPNPFSHGTPGQQAGRLGYNPRNASPSLSGVVDDPFTHSLDAQLQLEASVEQEFHSGVITQVYNYLSLGYPSLAHKFDAELSKISRLPVEDLRRDDSLANAKGYVGAPEGEGLEEGDVVNGRCQRWTALRLYVREWARQEKKGMMKSGANGNWGARVRRGSWAV